MDAERERAAFLVPLLREMSNAAEQLTAKNEEYQKHCVGILGTTASGMPILNGGHPLCMALAGEMEYLRVSLRREAAAVEVTARRAGVIPGVFRELVAAHGLQEYLQQ